MKKEVYDKNLDFLKSFIAELNEEIQKIKEKDYPNCEYADIVDIYSDEVEVEFIRPSTCSCCRDEKFHETIPLDIVTTEGEQAYYIKKKEEIEKSTARLKKQKEEEKKKEKEKMQRDLANLQKKIEEME